MGCIRGTNGVHQGLARTPVHARVHASTPGLNLIRNKLAESEDLRTQHAQQESNWQAHVDMCAI